MLFRSLISVFILLAAWSALPAGAQTSGGWIFPPGSCPPGTSSRDAEVPEQIPEAYYFTPRAATANQPAVNYVMTVWRRPCSQDVGASELRVNLSVPPGIADWRPKLVVVQDGVEHGCTGVNWPDRAINFYPGDCSGASGLRILPPAQVGNCGLLANCVNTDAEALSRMTGFGGSRLFTLSIDLPSSPFNPDRAFTIKLRSNWPTGTPDAVYEIPALGTPGNVARIPQNIAGMWWNPAEPGTALILDRNERGATFAAWLTYGDNGRSTWFVMTNGTAAGVGEVEGSAYAPRGEPFSLPGSNAAFGAEAVGRFNITFKDSTNAEFRWTVNGRSGMQPLQRFVVRNALGNRCTDQSSNVLSVRGLIGWGAQLSGSNNPLTNCTAQATLLTYDDEGRAMWVYGAILANVIRPGTVFSVSPAYATLFRPSGTPYGLKFDPQRFSTGAPAGSWDQTLAGLQVTLGSTPRILALERFRFEY